MPRNEITREQLEGKGYSLNENTGKYEKNQIKPSNAHSAQTKTIKPVTAKSVLQPKKTIVKPKPKHDDSFDSQLERDFDLVLRAWKSTGKILDYLHEPLKFCLGWKVFYKIDFIVIYEFEEGVYRFECHEVKGKHAWDDAIVKIKNAANLMPYMDFFLTRRNEQGQWVFQHIPPAGHKSWKTPKFEEK